MKTTIKIEQLTTGYISKKDPTRVVSKKVQLSVCEGELVLLMGPNGCGKSTLMNTISGLLPPLHGDVKITNQSTHSLKPKDRAKLLSLVLTDRIHSPLISVQDIIEIGRYPYVGAFGSLMEKDHEIVRQAIRICHLQGYEHRYFSELSDGEKQRVMIARALAQQTPVMLLDEPTAHLDLPSRLDVIMMLKTLTEQTGSSIIVSTHELDLALHWADTVWLMNKSGEIYSGSPEDLVLSGRFESVFGNEKLKFDQERGEFSVIQSNTIPVRLIGDGLRYSWTVRALERKGFMPSEDAGQYEIIIGEDDWLFRGERYSSLRDLIITLVTLHNESK
ncbi:ABC transporter ATP-binding protein [Porphyromonadaceae bacterium W3.11]|nr:ABC transporter ATP-binding protein [Porphyromonadaceae bacterium W3.11]